MLSNELSKLFQKAFVALTNGGRMLGVDPSANETGSSTIVIGNAVDTTYISPPSGKRLVVKGLFVNGNGNSGTATVESSTGTILIKSYFANNTSGVAPSDTVNLVLDTDATIVLRTVGRGATDETFFGVSYIVID